MGVAGVGEPKGGDGGGTAGPPQGAAPGHDQAGEGGPRPLSTGRHRRPYGLPTRSAPSLGLPPTFPPVPPPIPQPCPPVPPPINGLNLMVHSLRQALVKKRDLGALELLRGDASKVRSP